MKKYPSPANLGDQLELPTIQRVVWVGHGEGEHFMNLAQLASTTVARICAGKMGRHGNTGWHGPQLYPLSSNNRSTQQCFQGIRGNSDSCPVPDAAQNSFAYFPNKHSSKNKAATCRIHSSGPSIGVAHTTFQDIVGLSAHFSPNQHATRLCLSNPQSMARLFRNCRKFRRSSRSEFR